MCMKVNWTSNWFWIRSNFCGCRKLGAQRRDRMCPSLCGYIICIRYEHRSSGLRSQDTCVVSQSLTDTNFQQYTYLVILFVSLKICFQTFFSGLLDLKQSINQSINFLQAFGLAWQSVSILLSEQLVVAPLNYIMFAPCVSTVTVINKKVKTFCSSKFTWTKELGYTIVHFQCFLVLGKL